MVWYFDAEFRLRSPPCTSRKMTIFPPLISAAITTNPYTMSSMQNVPVQYLPFWDFLIDSQTSKTKNSKTLTLNNLLFLFLKCFLMWRQLTFRHLPIFCPLACHLHSSLRHIPERPGFVSTVKLSSLNFIFETDEDPRSSEGMTSDVLVDLGNGACLCLPLLAS